MNGQIVAYLVSTLAECVELPRELGFTLKRDAIDSTKAIPARLSSTDSVVLYAAGVIGPLNLIYLGHFSKLKLIRK
jgi:hypothetical protein